MDKKAQVTIFIIVGIVLLFLFAGVLYITQNYTKKTLTAEGEPIIADVPLAFLPLQEYTENCIFAVGKQGLVILGQQGGYLDPEVWGDYSVTNPTDSVGLNLEPTKVPYWHYNAEPNKADKIAFSSLQPELYYEDDPEFSIEAQLMRYVEENLDSCLDDYTSFREAGYVIEQGEKKVDVQIGESSVNFWLKMDLAAERGEAAGEMEQFYVRMPLKLKHMYETASKITGAEKEYSFLETQGMNHVAVFSGPTMDKLPPTMAHTFERAPTVFWNEFEVKQKIQRLLSSYIPMLRFLGSENFYDYVYPDSEFSGLYQATYDQNVINYRGAEDLEVGFDYFNWPIYLKTNSANGVIKPFHVFVSYWTLTIGQQTYETSYDISYPVMVTLNDKRAFSGEGYKFVFGLESNIRNNAAVKDGEERDVLPRPAARLACDPEHWDTGLLRTVVVDSYTQEPLDFVKVGFTIPEQDECEIGFTDQNGVVESKYPAVYGGVVNFINDDYLTNFYPIDTYPLKEQEGIIGYAAAGYPEKVIEMHKYKTVNVSVKKKNLDKCITPLKCYYTTGIDLTLLIPFKDIRCEKGKQVCAFNSTNNLFLDNEEPLVSLEANGSLSKYHDYFLSGGVEELSENETATIILRRVADLNDQVFSKEFSATVSVTGDEVAEVELVPGIYEVNGNMYLNEEIVIPHEKRAQSFDILTWESEVQFDFNETRVEKFMSGILTWDTPKSYLVITPDDLYPAQEIEFYMLNQNLKEVPEKITTKTYECVTSLTEGGGCVPKDVQINGRVVEDLQMIGQMINLSKLPEVRKALEPKFK